MALSNQKTDFKEWESEVEKVYPKKEYSGVYESVLHLKSTIEYMESLAGQKLLMDEFGEAEYLIQFSRQKKTLKTREAELKFLKGAFK